MALELEAEELRVIGSLIEKELTTPQQYPLTLNALVLACNQTSNRNPVVTYEERTVENTVMGLKDKGLTRIVHPSHGRSATRYRQVLHEALYLETEQLAVLGVMMLRGPQTLNELKTRTDRAADFADLDAVQATVDALANREEPLVVRIPRQSGQREDRFAHLLGGEVDIAEVAAAAAASAPPPRQSRSDEVADLRQEVEALRRDLDALRRELGFDA
ncbi:MAG: YceH family protein [Acidimicrobiia bacterium]|nr:YceH family protein [Acidimicrobiia bacterium]